MTLPAAVLFDLDDTLFAHREAVAHGILRHLDATGIAPPDRDASVSLWHELEERHYHSYLAGDLDYAGQRVARARDFAASYGERLTDAAAGRWFADYVVHYRAGWALHDDAVGCLDRLRVERPGVRIGIITNGDLDFQRAKIDAVALGGRLDGVVASGAVGSAKPDPQIFQAASAELDVDVADAAYVGDRLRTDAIGAARAGLTGVWLNRRGVAAAPDDALAAATLGVIEIATLDDLVPALLRDA